MARPAPKRVWPTMRTAWMPIGGAKATSGRRGEQRTCGARQDAGPEDRHAQEDVADAEHESWRRRAATGRPACPGRVVGEQVLPASRSIIEVPTNAPRNPARPQAAGPRQLAGEDPDQHQQTPIRVAKYSRCTGTQAALRDPRGAGTGSRRSKPPKLSLAARPTGRARRARAASLSAAGPTLRR